MTNDEWKMECLPVHHFDKDLHRPTANHTLLARFIGRERVVMQFGLARSHCRFRFGPNFRLDTTAADGSRNLAVLKEKHLRAALLRRRAARVCDRGHDHAFTACSSFVDQAIEIALWNRR